jgi:hypothetical protein
MMTRPLARYRFLLAALLLGSALPARAEETVPLPAADPRKAPVKPEDQIKNACDADAVAVRLADPAAKTEGDAPPPVNRPKDAQNTANRLGAGVESETDGTGQTLSWKRKGTPKDCREKLHRLRRDFPDRVTFEPTTEERIADVRRKRDAMIPEGMRRDAKNPLNGKLFDGAGALMGGLFLPKTDLADAVAAPSRPMGLPSASAVPVSYSPPAQLPAQYRGPLSNPVPQVQNYSPPTFSRRVVDAYESTKAYVSSSLDEAGKYVTGVARTVKNYFFSGIEMIQGYGYKFVHAGRATNWGTQPLVDGLRKIAAYMRGGNRAETDLAIGDISSANGGQLGGHVSHQRGRDVDIGFYMTDMNGKPVDAQGFVRFTQGRDGLTGSNNGQAVRFDAQRNWFLVQAILANQDPAFKPTHIFIANHLKAAILAAAGDSPEKARAAALMTYWAGHDNHLHLRVE